MKSDVHQFPGILLTQADAVLPAVIAARDPHASRRFVEFFTAKIPNPNTLKAHYRRPPNF